MYGKVRRYKSIWCRFCLYINNMGLYHDSKYIFNKKTANFQWNLGWIRPCRFGEMTILSAYLSRAKVCRWEFNPASFPGMNVILFSNKYIFTFTFTFSHVENCLKLYNYWNSIYRMVRDHLWLDPLSTLFERQRRTREFQWQFCEGIV